MRKIVIAWGPSATLDALASLAGARPRTRGPALVHDELRRELRRAVTNLEPALGAFTQCLGWLERRGHATLGRPASHADATLANAARAGELRVDLDALDEAAATEPRGTDGRAHATLFALRAVLRALHQGELFDTTATRAGSRRVTLADVLREVERRAKRHGFRDESAVPARFAQREPSPSPAVDAPKARSAAAHTPEPAAKPAAKPTRSRAKAAPASTTGFGGLPDDAVSDAPPPAPAEPDPPAPSVDATFFLREAGIDAWPCARATLDRARRAVITRLHPDRAGEHAARDFHRAIKGHAELVALLARFDPGEVPSEAPASAAPPAPAPPPPTPTASAPKRASQRRVAKPRPEVVSAAFQEWPPPPPASPAPPPPSTKRPAPAREVALDGDADFFLREASLAWPCAADALRDAWQSLSTRLRRMTPASTAAEFFARASRGYGSLLRAASAAA